MNSAHEILATHEADFYPSVEVVEQLRTRTLVAFIGAMAVGKTTCMEQVAKLDTEFAVVKSFATRPRRTNEPDNDYRFLDGTEDLDRIAAMVASRSGGLVQYGVHPTTGHVYGSEISDYNQPYSMLATLTKNVEVLRQTPFGKMVELTLVTEPTEWLRRFRKKGFSANEAKQRALEGKQSLEWSLDQGDNMVWVCTPSSVHPDTAVVIRRFSKRDSPARLDQSKNRRKTA